MQLRHGDKKIVCFDFETENANVATARPWQLAYVICDNKKIYKKVNRYIWWDDLDISEKARIITKFDYNLYKHKAEPPKNVLGDFEDLLNQDYYFVGHNVLNFDVFILNVLRRSLGLNENFDFKDKVLDTLCLEKSIYFNKDFDLENSFLNQIYFCRQIVKKGGMSLNKLLNKYEISYDEDKLHNALVDVLKNKDIFYKQAWRLRL